MRGREGPNLRHFHILPRIKTFPTRQSPTLMNTPNPTNSDQQWLFDTNDNYRPLFCFGTAPQSLKEQKEFVLLAIGRAIEAAHATPQRSKNQNIEIAIPSSATYTISNDLDALREFQKRVETKFKTQPLKTCKAKNTASKPRQTGPSPLAAPVLGNPKGITEIVAIVGTVSHYSYSSPAFGFVYSDGEYIIGTNGAQLVAVPMDAGGSVNDPHYYYHGIHQASRPTAYMGPWEKVRSIIPDPGVPFGTADTTDLFVHLRQSGQMSGEFTEMWQNPDGTFGFKSVKVDEGTSEVNIHNDGKLIDSYCSENLRTAVSIARNLGHERVTLEKVQCVIEGHGECSKLVIRGASEGKTPFIHMTVAEKKENAGKCEPSNLMADNATEYSETQEEVTSIAA